MPTHRPDPPIAPRAQLAEARRIARRLLSYGYFRSIHDMTRPYAYCPHRHKIHADVPGAATASQVTAALIARLTEHLIDTDEAQPNPR